MLICHGEVSGSCPSRCTPRHQDVEVDTFILLEQGQKRQPGVMLPTSLSTVPTDQEKCGHEHHIPWVSLCHDGAAFILCLTLPLKS